jgi:hypothetical protein
VAQRVRRTTRSAPLRQRVWARQLGTISLAASARGQASLDTQFATEYGTTRLPVGTTIGGIIVQYQAVQLIARAASTDALVGGIGLFDETTATETPDPRDDPHADWMWRLLIPTQSAAGSVVSPTLASGGPLRIKAMRKVSELNVRPWMVFRNDGTTTWDIKYDISLLLMLP